jgi:hypothetical protein
MSKNDLAVVDQEVDTFLALRDGSGVAEALKWNTGGAGMSAADLIRVPIPAGGATTWAFMNARGEEETCKEVSGILALVAMQGVIWPSEQPEQGRSPVIVTHDFEVGVRVSDDLGDLDPAVLEEARTGDRTYDWKRLAYTQFGSGSGGRGKRAKESRLLAILRNEEILPLLINAGPGSLKTVTQFVKRISSLGVPYFQTVVSLRLEKVFNKGGQPYSQIVPKLVRTLSSEDGVIVRDGYTLPLSMSVSESRVAVDD